MTNPASSLTLMVSFTGTAAPAAPYSRGLDDLINQDRLYQGPGAVVYYNYLRVARNSAEPQPYRFLPGVAPRYYIEHFAHRIVLHQTPG